MPDATPDLVVTRTIDVGGATVQLRVPRAVAEASVPELWRDLPPYRRNARLVAAAADGHACRLVWDAVRAGRIGAGRWRATFTGGDAVELEAV